MRHLIIIITLLVFVSCKKETKSSPATPPTTTSGGSATPTSAQTSFTQYYNKFLAYATAKGVTPNTSNFTMQYDTTHTTADGVLGVCYTYQNGARILGINQVYWEAWAVNGRKDDMEQLFFHELAHCTLSRGHLDTTLSGLAVSMMNSYHINTTYYKANHTYYIDELFDTSIAGTIALNTSGTQFDGSIYASRVVSKYAMTVSNFYDSHNDPETDRDIEEFHCSDSTHENQYSGTKK